MLLITGCRISEVCEMEIADIDFKNKQYQMFSKGKWRRIKLDSKTLWEDLKYWLYDDKGKVRTDKKDNVEISPFVEVISIIKLKL